MKDETKFNRRHFLQVTGAATATTFLAGCSGGGEETESEESGAAGESEPADNSGEETESESEEESSFGAEPDYGDWFEDVDSYDGTVDATGTDQTSVSVGAGSGLSFGPAAVAVDPGTTVVWEWTGQGGAHNVVAEDDTFDSGETVMEEGHTFEYTFETSGVYTYACTPHKPIGMKGAVVVTE